MWCHYDVMKRGLQIRLNLMHSLASLNIVFRGSNFITSFTFIYLESISLYVNWTLNYMLRKWRLVQNVWLKKNNIWKSKNKTWKTHDFVAIFRSGWILLKLEAKNYSDISQNSDRARNYLTTRLHYPYPNPFKVNI